jgi:Collagen triple helix repeat (20 copies)
MFQWIRRRLTYANVMMTLALVFAMSGGAYAAKHYLITSTKQISPKVLKQLQGKAGSQGSEGKQGSAGPAGPQGPVGSAGKGEKGERGEKGDPGTNGTNGTNGESVTDKAIAKGSASCQEGGAEFKVGSGAATFACNGAEGAQGEPGSPWTAGGTLPHGATETGTWSVLHGASSETQFMVSVSFSVPLSESISQFEYVGKGQTGSNCTGNAASPTAPSGWFCIYDNNQYEIGITKLMPVKPDAFVPGTGTAGALLFIEATANTSVLAFGSWAVTG